MTVGDTTVGTTTADADGFFSAVITPPTRLRGLQTVSATCGSVHLVALLNVVSTVTVSSPEGDAAVFSVFVILGVVLLRGQLGGLGRRRGRSRRSKRGVVGAGQP